MVINLMLPGHTHTIYSVVNMYISTCSYKDNVQIIFSFKQLGALAL